MTAAETFRSIDITVTYIRQQDNNTFNYMIVLLTSPDCVILQVLVRISCAPITLVVNKEGHEPTLNNPIGNLIHVTFEGLN